MPRPTLWITTLAVLIGLALPVWADTPAVAAGSKEVVIRLQDGSILRQVSLQGSVDIQTKYGKLAVPLTDIRRIDFGLHFPEETGKRIATAIGNLASPSFPEREKADKELVELGHLAFPALQEAARSKDPEVVRRAREAINRIRESVADELLELKAEDVIHTRDAVLPGQVVSQTLKVKTAHLGEPMLKLSDLRTLSTLENYEVNVDARKFAFLLGDVEERRMLDTGIDLDGQAGMLVVATGKGKVEGGEAAVPGGVAVAPLPALMPQPPRGIMHMAAGDLHGQLLGRIGENGQVFVVGKRFEGRTSEKGRLYLGLMSITGGEAQSLKVKITIDAGGAIISQKTVTDTSSLRTRLRDYEDLLYGPRVPGDVVPAPVAPPAP